MCYRDLSVELGATSNRTSEGQYSDPYRLARSLCLIGARAAGVEPIDAVGQPFDPAFHEAVESMCASSMMNTR